ncbi:MerC domain-containing protein [Reichenbachiella sp.]|uniref:MerC domain-containing protein n=1 Tax=Reichenbachiella sp. TaxID=2184521 RepID=UPI003B58B874
MKERFFSLHTDFLGFLISVLCAIHCAGLPFLLSLLPIPWLGFLENEWIEYAIILFSFCIANYALIKCYLRHHRNPLALIIVCIGFLSIAIGHTYSIHVYEILFTTLGALTIAGAHFINWKHVQLSMIR